MLYMLTPTFKVKAESFYLPEQSEPGLNRYAFGYTITIQNTGEIKAKLTHRYWLITDANGKEEEVHGKGVIGKQPSFEPGESFEYTSGVILATPVGAMEGHYELISENGDLFQTPIAAFGLAVPGSLN